MAKRASSAAEEAQTTNGVEETEAAGGAGEGGERGESIAGYFRRLFKENPHYLKERSNEPLLRRWLDDHPGFDTVPDNVKVGLQNVKGVLRRKLAERKGRRQAAAAAESPQAGQASPRAGRRAPSRELEALEERIDDCLTLAKSLDREGLAEIIEVLRQARNEVVRRLTVG